MGLGELYKPSGKALEHAIAVLETKNIYAINVALGCSLGCRYCYIPNMIRRSRRESMRVRHPKVEPVELVKKQFNKGLRPKGVFVSFLTEPFLPSVRDSTERLVKFLVDEGVRVATSSKVDVLSVHGVRNGMTIVSLDEGFWRMYEPRTPPPKVRVSKLKRCHEHGEYTWVSLEPLPCPSIWSQNMTDVLEVLGFVDFMILGKWNYQREALTERARKYYGKAVNEFRNFCEDNGIRYHIKKGTTNFIVSVVTT